MANEKITIDVDHDERRVLEAYRKLKQFRDKEIDFRKKVKPDLEKLAKLQHKQYEARDVIDELLDEYRANELEEPDEDGDNDWDRW